PHAQAAQGPATPPPPSVAPHAAPVPPPPPGAPAAQGQPYGQQFAAQGAPSAAPSGPVGGPTAPTQSPKRKRTGLLVAAAVVGVVAVGAGSVFGYKMLAEGDTPPATEATDEPGESTGPSDPTDAGDANSGADSEPSTEAPVPGGAKTEAGWRLTVQDKTVTIPGPKPEKADNVSKCDTMHIDIDNDFSVNQHGNIDAADFLGALAYHACEEPDPEEGFQATDGSIMNTVTAEFPTPSTCLKAARDSSLPNPVPLDKLRDDSVLKKGVGICVETADKAVAHLWIRKVNRDSADSLPTYLTSATLWEPDK
ncbi:hypothetical protein GUY60_32805, partial [Streptomyces sp. YC537]|nr:hypothetical protein [Streptomyces boluensis]